MIGSRRVVWVVSGLLSLSLLAPVDVIATTPTSQTNGGAKANVAEGGTESDSVSKTLSLSNAADSQFRKMTDLGGGVGEVMLSAGPVRVKAGDIWRDLDMRLVRKGELLVPQVGGVSTSFASKVKVGEPIVRVATSTNGLAGAATSMLKDAAPDASVVEPATAAGDPTLELVASRGAKASRAGSGLKYVGIAKGVQLHASATPRGAVTNFRIADKALSGSSPGLSDRRLVLSLRAQGVSVAKAGKSLRLVDSQGRIVGTTGKLVAVDRAGRVTSLAPQVSRNVGGVQQVKLNLAKAAVGAQYPLRIMLPLLLGRDGMSSVSSDRIPAVGMAARAGAGGSEQARSFLRFPTLGAEDAVTSAKLRVRIKRTSECRNNSKLVVKALSQPFDADATWAKQPKAGSKLGAFDRGCSGKKSAVVNAAGVSRAAMQGVAIVSAGGLLAKSSLRWLCSTSVCPDSALRSGDVPSLIVRIAGRQEPVSDPAQPDPVSTPAPEDPGTSDLLEPSQVSLRRTDVASAKLAAGGKNEPVRAESLTTQDSVTVVMPDGTYRKEVSTGPARIKMNEQWQELDMTVTDVGESLAPAVAGHSVTLAKQVEANESVVEVSTTGVALQASARAHIDENAGSVPVARSNSSNDPSLSLIAPTALGAATIAPEGAYASYGFGPDAQLQIRPMPQGFGAQIVYESAPADTSPSLTLATKKIDAKLIEDGAAIALTNKSGQQVGRAGTAVISDANGTSAAVGLELDEQSADGWGLTLHPPASVFTDAAYPLVLDLGVVIAPYRDQFVERGYGAQVSDLRIGTYDGSHLARTMVKFHLSFVPGTVVSNSVLTVFEDHAGDCANKEVSSNPITSSWSMNSVWPGPDYGGVMGTFFTKYGGPKPCDGRHHFSTTVSPSLVYAWGTNPSGSPANRGVMLKSNESEGGNTWRRVCSSRQCDIVAWRSTRQPRLIFDYASPPDTPTDLGVTPEKGNSVPSLTPYLSAFFASNGGAMQAVFGVNNSAGSRIWTSPAIPVGNDAAGDVQVPAGVLVDDGVYQFQVEAFANGLHSGVATSGWWRVDVTPPNPVRISADDGVTNGGWVTNPASPTVNFVLNATDSDVEAIQVTQDGYSLPDIPVNGTTPVAMPWTPGNGWHNLTAQAVDKAGNLSSQVVWEFGLGPAEIGKVGIQGRSARYFDIKASTQAPVDKQGLSAQVSWRVGSTMQHQLITTGLTQNGSPWSGNVVVDDSAAVLLPDGVVWDVLTTQESITDPDIRALLNAPAVINIQVCFRQNGVVLSAGCTPDFPVQLVAHAFGGNFATAPAGPGEVSLMTGELSLSSTDAVLPGATTVSMDRSWMSYTGTGIPGVFGPGWQTSTPAPQSGVMDALVTDKSDTGAIILGYPSGDVLTYGSNTPGDGRYSPIGLTAEDGSFMTLAGTSLTLTEADGTVTTWNKESGIWVPVTVVESAAQGAFKYFQQTPTAQAAGFQAVVTGNFNNGGTSTSCSVLPSLQAAVAKAGCRILTLNISAASGITPSPAGPYPGRADNVTIQLWDHGSGQPVTQTVARYAYNTDGLLVQAWDPRLDGSSGSLKTLYTYDHQQLLGWVLTSVTPASAQVGGSSALQPFTFTYDAPLGRLATIARNDPVLSATPTTYVVYGVAMSGTGLPTMTPEAVEGWDQSLPNAPQIATAVFPPDPGLGAFDPAHIQPSQWVFAHLHYMNGLGATVNTAEYGAGDWQIDTTQYDVFGQVIKTLSAANRAMALAPRCAAAPVVCALPTNASRAAALASYTFYNPTMPGVVTDQYGPIVQVSPGGDGTGAKVEVRSHTHTDYNNGAPQPVIDSGAALPTSTVSGGFPVTTNGTIIPGPMPNSARALAVDIDTRQTITGYAAVVNPQDGWTLRAPTQTTTVMSGADIVAVTGYDSAGRVVQSRQPMSNGADAGTTLTTYYSVIANVDQPSCGNTAEWEGLPCFTTLAGRPQGTPGLPATTTTYSVLLAPSVITEVTTGAPGDARTTTITYDTAGRQLSSAISGGPSGSTTLPQQTYTYDPATGLQTTTSAGAAGQVQTSYDTWGREIIYTDTDGTTSSTSYDLASRVATRGDGQGTYSYTYDSATEHRGLLTAQSVSGPVTMPGNWTVSYDAGARPVSATAPNGVVESNAYDAAGALVARQYAAGNGTVLTSWTQTVSSHGQVINSTGTSPLPGTRRQAARYDGAGRLIVLGDLLGGVCNARAYTLDANSDRAASAFTASTPGPSVCAAGAQRNPVSSASTTFNAASQALSSTRQDTGEPVQSGSYVYDSLGRTTSAPGVDMSSGLDPSPDYPVQYYVDDYPSASQTVTNGETALMQYSRDPLRRLSGSVSTVTDPQFSQVVTTKANHYADGSDAPSWVYSVVTIDGQGVGPVTMLWNVVSPTGGLGIQVTVTTQPDPPQSPAGSDPGSGDPGPEVDAELVLINPHGDVAAMIANTAAVAPGELTDVVAYDEFGNVLAGVANSPYGWEGAARRDSAVDEVFYLIQMGARQYNPLTGRFTTVDPVAGGNANRYTYPTDPINGADLDGAISSRYREVGRSFLKGRVLRQGSVGFGATHMCIKHRICGEYTGLAAVIGQLDTPWVRHPKISTRREIFTKLSHYRCGQSGCYEDDRVNLKIVYETLSYSGSASSSRKNALGVVTAYCYGRRLNGKKVQKGKFGSLCPMWVSRDPYAGP